MDYLLAEHKSHRLVMGSIISSARISGVGLTNPLALQRDDVNEENKEFTNHLEVTTSWFTRISCVNKKLYLLALLEDVRSAWSLSLLLKSIWNSRPKDSVLSISGPILLSIYDRAPMDHNRTAIPESILTKVMTDDRQWFLSLESEKQAMVLLELLSVAGGPVIWEVLKRAQNIYNRHRAYELQNMKESVITVGSPPDKNKSSIQNLKKELMRRKSGDSGFTTLKQVPQSSLEQKQLEESLAVWNLTIKLIRDSLKLEEIETISNDGTKKKVWKVDRPKPEITETVDYLLPSAIAKRILSYLPQTQLNDYSHVNKYSAYLIDELKTEVVARQKIDTELEKLREVMLRNEESTDSLGQSSTQIQHYSSQPPSLVPTMKTRPDVLSAHVSQKSGPYSFRHLREKMSKPTRYRTPKPIHNMADLYKRLEIRGAADENIWKWCKNVQKQFKKLNTKGAPQRSDGVLSMDHTLFPCPLVEQRVSLPLSHPLVKDPAAIKIPLKSANFKIKLSKETNIPYQQQNKRYGLWSKDFSSLYPVSKIASHQSPI